MLPSPRYFESFLKMLYNPIRQNFLAPGCTPCLRASTAGKLQSCKSPLVGTIIFFMQNIYQDFSQIFQFSIVGLQEVQLQLPAKIKAFSQQTWPFVLGFVINSGIVSGWKTIRTH